MIETFMQHDSHLRQWQYRRVASGLLLTLLLLLAGGCSFGFGGVEATPEAVDLPTYEPGAEATPLAAGRPSTTTVPADSTAEAPATEPAAEPTASSTPASDEETAAGEETVAGEEPATDEAAAPATPATTATEEDAAATVSATPVAAAEPDATEGPITPTIAPPAPEQLIGVYPAEIAPDDEVVIVAEVPGQVLELAVEVGDQVQAGDLIARLDSSALEAQRMQALAGVQAATAQLNQLRNPADEEDLEAARAALAAARAGYNRAVGGPTEEERRQALAQLQQAQAAVNVATAGYNLVRSVPELGALPQSLQLQAATLALEAAQAQYDKIIQGATQDQIAGAYAQVVGAQAQLQQLQEGVDPAQIRAAEAGVRTAENALYLAQLQINNATVKAPVAGIVAEVQTQAGALAAPGVPLLTLLSPTVNVTIAVEEARLGQLSPGQPAIVRVTAYPDLVFAGVVESIAPELDPATRTVEVTIRPEDPDGLLRPGLSAQVELYE
jgi:multidrug efflux pump subunit AcrA (membrane-fusion protein)